MAKGGEFERAKCKELSLWWSEGERDDVFWRTSGSGARATVRAKRGKTTFGQSGDIAATHPDGLPFLGVFNMELKRGYNKDSPLTLIDRKPHQGLSPWELWLWRCIEEAGRSGTLGWMIIQRRDQKSSMAWWPTHVFNELRRLGSMRPRPRPFARVNFTIREPVRTKGSSKSSPTFKVGDRRMVVDAVGCRWEDFLWVVQPRHVQELAKAHGCI